METDWGTVVGMWRCWIDTLETYVPSSSYPTVQLLTHLVSSRSVNSTCMYTFHPSLIPADPVWS